MGRQQTFVVQEPPFFEVREFQAPDSAPRGTTITVNATVENTGDLQDTQTIEYRFDGTAEATQTVTLNPGEATTVDNDGNPEFAGAGGYVNIAGGITPAYSSTAIRVTTREMSRLS
ncbi:hypothetical protein BRD19_01915 [Halobacteriales archaeon SW_7_65_23]|nr:MAG: hypothetical protein BRD19_01915 [Halobacteriales archaeon SW_7_65_23]